MKKFTLLLGTLLSCLAAGQWTENYNVNTLVADAPTGDIQSVGTNDGKTYVVFWDESNGYELRVQLLDAEGNQVFGSDGMLANNVADNGSWTATRAQAVDADGNLYIGFTATNDGNGYVNKISPTGEQLFGAGGINLGPAWNLNVAPTSDGGVVVGWENGGTGRLMKFSNTGEEVWNAPIVLATPNPSSPFTGMGELVVLPDDSALVLFPVKATSWTVNSILWGQRFDTDGNPVWNNPVQISTKTTMSNRRYSIVQDGNVTYLGYYGSTGFRFDSLLQRINPDGTLPWGADGSDFGTDDNYYEMTTTVAMEQGSPYIWAAANICNDNQSQYGQSIQKFNKETGEVLLDFFGKTVFPVSADNWVSVGNLQLVDNQPFFLFSNGVSNGVNSIQLGVVLLDEEGEFVWQDEYEMIATSAGNKGRYDFTKNVDGQSVAVWTEPRDGTSRAYAQNFKVEIETEEGCLDAPNGPYPSNAYTPACVGIQEVITDLGWFGEYSIVNVTEGTDYNFHTDVTTAFITISNEEGSTVLATGTGSVNWTAAFSGSIRFYTHENDECLSSQNWVERYVQCGEVPPPPVNCEDFEVLSNGLEDGYFFGGNTSQRLATDIQTLDSGFTIYGMEPTVIGEATSFNFTFYSDNAGVPGTELETRTGTIVDNVITGQNFGYDFIKYTIAFDSPITFDANTIYWIEVQSDAGGWEVTSALGSTIGYNDVFANTNVGGAWTPTGGSEYVFNLICEELGVSDLSSFDFAYYPNPAKDFVNITSNKNIQSASVYNLAGQKVIDTKVRNGQINVTALIPGTYVFKVVLEGGQIETFKIIKK